MQLRIAVACLLAVVAGCRGHGEPNAEPISAYREPVQAPLDAATNIALPELVGAHLNAKASYRIDARVLSSERYYFGWQSDLSPLDLALGWGNMSDSSVDKWISWHQAARWYLFNYAADSPYDEGQIHLESANVHIVPATTNLKRALLALQPSALIRLQGYLLDVAGPSGEQWSSSMTRTDTGDHSCELMYVSSLTTDGKIYR